MSAEALTDYGDPGEGFQDDLSDWLMQECPGEVEQAQVALAEITHLLDGEFSDLTDLEAVFVDGRSCTEYEGSLVLERVRRIARNELKDEITATQQEVPKNVRDINLGVLEFRFCQSEMLTFTETVDVLEHAYGAQAGLKEVFKVQTECLLKILSVLERAPAEGMEKPTETNHKNHEGDYGIDVPPTRKVLPLVGVEAPITVGSISRAIPREKEIRQSSHPSSAVIQAEVFHDSVCLVTEYLLYGAPISLEEHDIDAIKAAMRNLTGSKALESAKSEVYTRFAQANYFISGVDGCGDATNQVGTHQVLGRPLPPWSKEARCLKADPETFFPEKGGSTREAKRICACCDVREECLEYALANDERFGVLGGLSERERRRLKRQAG